MEKAQANYKNVKEQVGEVKTIPDRVSLDDLRNRWGEVFAKHGNLKFDTIMNAWGAELSSLDNPYLQNARVKKINSAPKKYTKKDLEEIMKDPQNNEVSLQSVSMGLYYSNFIYQMLIQLNRHTPSYKYYATPLYTNGDKKNLKTESQKIDRLLKKFNPQLTFKTIATQVYQQGKCSYLVRTSHDKDDVAFLLLQKLNSDMVKITSFGSKQQFIASFNMAIFLEAGYDISQYPPFIREAWDYMINNKIILVDKRGVKRINPKVTLPKGHLLENVGKGTYMYWVELPQDLCYTFYSDGSHPNAFPDTIGLFTDLNDLDDYRWLQGNLLSKGVNSLLTAEVPLVKDPKPGGDSTAISPDTILGYTDLFNSCVSANIFPFFAPFENFDLHSLENQPESLNIIYSRIRDLIATSGNSALLSLSEKPTVASTKAAELIQASKNDYLTRQFEQFLNNVINENFDLKNTWDVKLHSDIFFWRDDAKMVKEMVMGGAKHFTPRLLSYFNMTLEDCKGQEIYLDTLDIDLIPDRLEDAAANAVEKNPVGRPRIPEDEIENDNTDTSIQAGNNISDLKEFSKVCCSCGTSLDYEENFLCTECFEKEAESRI